ncbi:MAG: hypothetical protein A2Y38_05980 [Spirochaetes bacterium GWB1_59_5]|nr:MAG: hypothetical protein A2Y38_05980 [Spirochaetes bacterium GWB1_59_5]
MRVRGVSGELRHGYQQAAALGAWAIESEDRIGYVCRAQVEAESDVWSARRPLDLILVLGPVEWTWRGVEPDLAGGTVRIVLDRRPDVVTDRLPG